MVNKAEWLNNVYRDTGYSTVETSAGSQAAAGESSAVEGLTASPLAPLASPKAPRGQKMMKGLTGVVHKVKGTRCGAAVWEELKSFFLDTKLNVLLVCLPIAIVSHQVGWGDGPTFVLSCLALVSLAERLGFVTENLASYTNDTLGGLLNASFGNATEVIISAFALKAGYLRVVQLTLLGSIISNLLLVMGSAFLLGGMKRSHQQFNRMSSSVSCSLLMLSSFVILLPSLLSETHTEASVPAGRSELTLSRFESVCMLICYGLFLVFQLYTHRHLYEDQPEEKEKTEKTEPPSTANESAPATRSPLDAPTIQGAGDRTGSGRPNAGSRTSSGRPKPLQANSLPLLGNGTTEEDVEMQPLFGGDLDNNSSKNNTGLQPRRPSVPGIRDGDEDALGSPTAGGDGGGGDDDDDEPVLSRFGCFIWLTVITLFVSLLSEYIMDALTGAAVQLHIPLPFLTTILLPIVGNAAEHASALVFAYKNRIEISLGVAVGSSTQVGVLVVPFCVVMGWAMGQPLDLDFNTFEAMVLFLSVMLAAIVLQDGHSNWIKGCVLMFSYVFIAGGFWCHKDTTLSIQQVAGH